jgi:signal transduction histidine kinase
MAIRNKGLLYWQYEFFYILSTFSVLGGSVAFTIGVLSYTREGFSFMAPVVSALFVMVILSVLLKNVNFKIRCMMIVTLYFLFGIYFLSVKGYQGLGLVFLLAYLIVTSVLLGAKAARVSLGVVLILLTGMNLLLFYQPDLQASFGEYAPLFWLSVSVGFFMMATLITISVSRLLAKLNDSLAAETAIRQNLEIEIAHRKELQDALSAERNSLQRRVEERTAQLTITNAQLEDAMKFRDLFFATVSHELRTPIHTITGYSHLLQKSGEDIFTEKQRTYLERLDEGSEHLLQVINDILDITRIQAGKLELKIESIPLRETCEGAAHFIRLEAEKKNIQVNVIFQQPVRTIIADPQRFKQIMINLLSNAVKFTPENGLVGITIDSTGEKTKIEVWDTGIGIAEAEQQMIFTTFYRTSNAGMEDVQGTGLGLALVKNLVEAHGWQIDFESKKDEGSSFMIWIPQTSLDPSEPSQLLLRLT